MNLEKLRAHCLSHPGATEQIQWGADLVFKVGGKMFCVACTEPAANAMSFKCDDETFAELIEREGATPAPYMARNKWVARSEEGSIEAPLTTSPLVWSGNRIATTPRAPYPCSPCARAGVSRSSAPVRR